MNGPEPPTARDSDIGSAYLSGVEDALKVLHEGARVSFHPGHLFDVQETRLATSMATLAAQGEVQRRLEAAVDRLRAISRPLTWPERRHIVYNGLLSIRRALTDADGEMRRCIRGDADA